MPSEKAHEKQLENYHDLLYYEADFRKAALEFEIIGNYEEAQAALTLAQRYQRKAEELKGEILKWTSTN